ncbi:CaiB/BaiF CoA transferase family protein [Achromobacter aloeverae]
MGILSGITILDLSRIFAAPFATQMLSDLGAKVWKIESFAGDDSRRWGSHVFDAYNRGKKSLSLNLKDVRAQQILQRLAAKSDVFVENFKTGDMERYGLSYPLLSRTNPRLIYLSLTGFGNTGPRSGDPGYDTVIQAMSGIMSLTGDAAGPPTRVGVAWIDVMSGLVSVIAILSALVERGTSGRGQHIDLSLFDVGMMALADAAQAYLKHGQVQQRVGNVTRNISPAQVFRTADGWIVIAIGNDAQFARLCQVLGCPGLTGDARFASNPDRVKHRDELNEYIVPLFALHDRDPLLKKMKTAKIPAGPVFNIDESVGDPQSVAREAIWSIPDEAGMIGKYLANPLRHLSRTPASPSTIPPDLGQHTFEVLSEELQLDTAEIDKLAEAGVIQLRR